MVERFKFSKAQRLKRPEDYSRVYSNKQWGGSKHYSYNVKAAIGICALGVTVSKKVSKRAVDRNRIKREVKEFYRLHQQQICNAELVITAKPSAKAATVQERTESLEQLWVKILKWQRWHIKHNAEEKPA